MKTAEKYRMQNLKPEFFEKYLPYTMIFEVEKNEQKPLNKCVCRSQISMQVLLTLLVLFQAPLVHFLLCLSIKVFPRLSQARFQVQAQAALQAAEALAEPDKNNEDRKALNCTENKELIKMNQLFNI